MLAVVAGSGIGLLPLLKRIEWERRFSSFPGLSDSSVPGHASKFVFGMVGLTDGGEQPLLIQCGRRHAYEGLGYADTVRTVDVLAELGATAILFTNAVGAIDPALRVGDIVAMTECMVWPYANWQLPERIAPAFVPEGPAAGPCAFMHGPCYETPAEIRALRALGVSTVGMSTAPEIHRCNELALSSGALSVVTNTCGAPHKLAHEDVVAAAKAASERVGECVRGLLV